RCRLCQPIGEEDGGGQAAVGDVAGRGETRDDVVDGLEAVHGGVGPASGSVAGGGGGSGGGGAAAGGGWAEAVGDSMELNPGRKLFIYPRGAATRRTHALA